MGKPGIKSMVVFGDSLSDSGNSAIWAERYADITDPALVLDPSLIPTFPYPYYQNRACNGPVWIEIAAEAYGYKVAPAMAGGMNFAFAGAESGGGLSDQYTPNFHSQIRLYRMALERELLEPPMPWQLFVVWFGQNDVLRALAEAEQPLDPSVFIPELAASIATNIAQGIVSLHELGARMFLVPNMPPLHLTPYGASQKPKPDSQRLLAAITSATNTALASALDRIEGAYDKVTILRLDVEDLYTTMMAGPGAYGLANVKTPAFTVVVDEQGNPQLVWLPVNPFDDPANPDSFDQNLFLSWDGFHPTVAAHAVVAQEAMNIIPIGSWWGKSMARGPGGNAWTSMGWVNDMHWPWVYSYSLQDGVWMWAYEEGGTPEGFYAYLPKSYKWLFVNLMSGWYYDYSTATWQNAKIP